MKTEAEIFLNKHAVARYEMYGTWPGKHAVRGFQLESGDELRATDVYDSTSGNWEPCPAPGLKLMDGAGAVWVRPE